MRRTTIAMLTGLVFLTALTAADKPATPSEQLETLKKELEKTRKAYSQTYKKAKTDKERQEIREEEYKHCHDYARRALELARKLPKDPVALDALSWIITGGIGWLGAGTEIEAAFDLLRKDYVTSEKLQLVCFHASILDGVSTKPERFLRAILEKNPHHEIQGWACYSLGRSLRRHADEAKRWREVKGDPAQVKMIESYLSAEVIKRIKSADPDKPLQEAEHLFERIISEYGDVKTKGKQTLGDMAKATLFEMRHLVIGKPAAEIEGEDIDGKRFKLSDYRGKVVVLDFWGNW